MSIEIIKEYLVEIGFTVDKPSFTQAEKTIQKMEGTLEKLFKSIAKLFKSFIDGVFENKHIRKPIEKVTAFFQKIAPKIQTFLMTTRGLVIASVGAVVAAVVAGFAVLTQRLHRFMTGVAQADMEIQKFARRMLTTVENARSLKAVMDAMGVQNLDELNDVAFNPELRSQFLALRGIASGMALGEDAQEGLKNIRAFNFEFQKLSLIVNYFFQQLAGHLGKFLGGPLQDIQKLMASFNEFLANNASGAARGIAETVGIFFKLFQILIKINAVVAKLEATLLGKLFPGIDKYLGSFVGWIVGWIPFLLDLVNDVLDASNSFLDNLGDLKNPITGKDTPVKSLTYYLQKILNILEQFWNWAYKIIRDPFEFLANKGKKFLQGVWKGVTNLVMPKAEAAMSPAIAGTKTPLEYLLKIAKQKGLTVTSTTGGVHSRNSRHYTGEAIDVAPNVSLEKIQRWAAEYGFTVLDERKNTGGRGWSGPHYHLQMTTAQYAARMNSLRRQQQQQTETQASPSAPVKSGGVQQQVSIYINGASFNEEKLVATIKSQLQQAAGLAIRMNQGAYV